MTTTTNSTKDVDALTCARHFKTIMGSGQKGWVSKARLLLDTYSLSPAELMDFMTWAAQENISDKPQLCSVEYLAKASDPMASLVKNAPGLIRLWRAKRKSSWETWEPTLPCPYCEHTASDSMAIHNHALTHCTPTATAVICPRCHTEFPSREVLYHDCGRPKPASVDDLYVLDRYLRDAKSPDPAKRNGAAFFYCKTCGQKYPHAEGVEQMLRHIETVHADRLRLVADVEVSK